MNPLGGAGDTLTVTSSVPEPSTWISLLLGFVTLGSFLRSRRAEAGAVTA
ncbi:PEP-CTERM sorting domain-containing protein (plasmid) [Polymorphobacter sp. PAMC 29334]|nr:PEP-CTERM sorting domain-containing protein [Polymorphobacter sp. PAMC 29334]